MKRTQNIKTKSIFFSKDIYLYYIIIGLVTNEYIQILIVSMLISSDPLNNPTRMEKIAHSHSKQTKKKLITFE